MRRFEKQNSIAEKAAKRELDLELTQREQVIDRAFHRHLESRSSIAAFIHLSSTGKNEKNSRTEAVDETEAKGVKSLSSSSKVRISLSKCKNDKKKECAHHFSIQNKNVKYKHERRT
jgi:hypothetical protein